MFVAVRIGQTDVQHLGAAFDLGAPDIRGTLEFAGVYQVPEPFRTDDVGALADDYRAIVGLQGQIVEARDGHDRAPRRRPWPFALGHVGQHFNVLRGGAAAAAGHVQPAVVDESFKLHGKRCRCLVVMSILVRQARIGMATHRHRRQIGEASKVVRHEFRAGGAVQADRQGFKVSHGGVERLHVLPAEHGAHRFDGNRNHERYLAACLGHGLPHAHDRGLEVQGVLRRFDQQEINAAVQQPQRLFPECLRDLFERHAAGNRYGLGLGPQRPRGKARLVGCVVGRYGLPGQTSGFDVDGMYLVFKLVFGKHDTGAPEGVGTDDVGAGSQVGVVNLAQRVWARQVQMLVAALVIRASEVARGEWQVLQVRAHRSVQNQDAFLQQFPDDHARLVFS